MAYKNIKWTSQDGRIIISKKYHTCRTMPKNPKIKERRAPRTQETDPQQEKINERHRREKNIRLLADNFHPGDNFITLTTDERKSGEEFKKITKLFMDKLRRAVKKTGQQLKYFRVLENLKGRGRPHAHLLINKFCDDGDLVKLLRKIWPHGFSQIKAYGGQITDAYNVASYYGKQSKKETGAKIDTSRNLIRREPKKMVVHAETFRDEIKPPKGYRVVLPLSYNGYTQDGYPYQCAVFERSD